MLASRNGRSLAFDPALIEAHVVRLWGWVDAAIGSRRTVVAYDRADERQRRVQMALNQKGFMVGKPDGVLGPRTRNALIAFQRQQGLEATGKIDQPSIAALSLSNGVGSTTTGRSGAGTP